MISPLLRFEPFSIVKLSPSYMKILKIFSYFSSAIRDFLGAKAPLGLAHVKIKEPKK